MSPKQDAAWDAMVGTFRAVGMNDDAVLICAKAAAEFCRVSVEENLEGALNDSIRIIGKLGAKAIKVEAEKSETNEPEGDKPSLGDA